jgi:hypothetical protein
MQKLGIPLYRLLELKLERRADENQGSGKKAGSG